MAEVSAESVNSWELRRNEAEDVPYATLVLSGGRSVQKKRRYAHPLFAALVGVAVMTGFALITYHGSSGGCEEVPAPNMPPSFQVGVYSTLKVDEPVEVMYGLYIPPHFKNERGPFPLIVYLHGYGDRTPDRFLKIGLPGSIKARIDKRTLDETMSEAPFNFIAFFPVDPSGTWTADSFEVGLVMQSLDEVIRRHNIDPSRIYLTGLSSGGAGVWRLAQSYPDKWAAVAPLSSIASPDPMKVRHIPMRIFHGAKDEKAPVAEVRTLVQKLREVGAKMEYFEYPDEGHVFPRRVYDTDELFDWFALQKKGD